MNGGGTNPDFHTFAQACSQVKKAMEVTVKLGGENYVFWGGREGYQTILNTDFQELDHMAALFKMAISHKADLGSEMQLLIEPKPREPTKHQYDYDAQTCMAFLQNYGLEDHFKLNIEPNHTTLAGHDYEHDLAISSYYNMLGSVDANTGDPLLGWDTDQFSMDFYQTTMAMLIIVGQGGLAPGGLNFDAKVRRESTDLADLFIAHVGAFDTFAKGLLNVEKMLNDGTLQDMVKARYSSWDGDLATKVRNGEASFSDMEAFIMEKGEPKQTSSQQELYERVFQSYLV